jgi:hypothetical protein
VSRVPWRVAGPLVGVDSTSLATSGFGFAHHERTRHPKLQLLSTEGRYNFDPERKGRPPAYFTKVCHSG